MLHLGRKLTKPGTLDLKKHEIDAYLNNGINGVIVEDYYGDLEDVQQTFLYLYQFKKDIIYGVNCLWDYQISFELAKLYNAKFIQIDSICGHLPITQDNNFGVELNNSRNIFEIIVIGGVRFKYQPYLSGRSLKEDLEIGMQRCDGIVVTGSGTGLETPLDKIKRFREVIGNFPLIIGAGLTVENCIKNLSIGNAAIVGSYVKENHQVNEEVSSKHVNN